MKSYAWFLVGYFISIFATHNFGWEPTIKCGWILVALGIFYYMIDCTITKDAKRGKSE